MTIRDVAAAAGVSMSTVSRAFARPGRVNAQTARRIRQIADELGYHAQSVDPVRDSERMTRQIAFVVSDMANPLFASYIKHAQHECLKRGYCLLVIDSEESRSMERRSVELVRSHVDGIVLGSSRLSDASIRKLAETIPLVTINRPMLGVRSVISDVRGGLTKAVDHLLELGHRRIVYVSGPQDSWQEGVRWQTVLALSRARGFLLSHVVAGVPTYNGGYRVAQSVLDTHATAVVTYNDLVAVGLIAAMRAQGVRVPQRISVVGIDDVPVSSLITPKLTTVHMPSVEVSTRAVNELIDGLHHVHRSGDCKPILIDSTLAVRDSTAPVRAAVAGESGESGGSANAGGGVVGDAAGGVAIGGAAGGAGAVSGGGGAGGVVGDAAEGGAAIGGVVNDGAGVVAGGGVASGGARHGDVRNGDVRVA